MDMKDSEFRVFQELMRLLAGITIPEKKKMMVEAKVQRRLSQLNIPNVNKYIDYLTKHANKEIPFLLSSLTIHFTQFFREKNHFDFLEKDLLKNLMTEGKTSIIKGWSAASSTGEEVYSLAITMLECAEKYGYRGKLQLVASDVDPHTVSIAEQGVYRQDVLKDLPLSLQKKYFVQGQGDISEFYKVKKNVRSLVEFRQQNLTKFPYEVPQTDFDFIFTRNVFIYFDRTTIEKITKEFSRHLKSDGFLILGHSESIFDMVTPFQLTSNSIYKLAVQEIDPINNTNASGTSSEVEDITRNMKKSIEDKLVKVLIVDDSATIRGLLKQILTHEHGFKIVAEAEDPIIADQLLKTIIVDVITLDIHMERKDGITWLEELQRVTHPPVVMISSISREDAVSSLRAFELGAFDYIEKPEFARMGQISEKIRQVVKAAKDSQSANKQSNKQAAASTVSGGMQNLATKLIAIGSSTGGVEAITTILKSLPAQTPPILIVQHIPPYFSKALADRLNNMCKVKIKEAEQGEIVEHSKVYIAPGGFHMKVEANSSGLVIRLTEDKPVHNQRPAVDVLFESLLPITKTRKLAAAVLTGMGKDGAKGLKALRDKGSYTIAQDEATCVVFGMPKEAIALGGAVDVLPLGQIGTQLFEHLR